MTWFGTPFPDYECDQVAQSLANAEGKMTEYWNDQEVRDDYKRQVLKAYVLYKTFQQIDFHRLT